MPKMIYLLSLLIVGGLFPLMARARDESGNEASIQIRGGARYKDKTGVQIDQFQVLDNMRWTTVALEISVDQGTVAWQILDPRGAVQWEGSVAKAGRLEEERRFEAVEGNWKLRLEMSEATGDYRVRWRGRS